MAKRIAVVLLNLGGPDSLKAVRPFLFNLFYDPAIIRLPNPLRWFIARLISTLRAKKAQGIYSLMGGASPLVPNTQAQADALETLLNGGGKQQFKVFIAMRYWHPMTAHVVSEVKDFEPDEVVLLPLYPQFSTTTTASSFKVWHEEAKALGLEAKTHTPCCYPKEKHFIEAHVGLIEAELKKAEAYGVPKLLFSAHSLPQKVIDAGDPYQWQVEETAKAIIKKLGPVDYTVCYQSRVGPVKWLEPQTEDTIKLASQGGRPIVIVPIAFVSDHSETLVELDQDYHEKAKACGTPYYGRVQSLGVNAAFIEGLKAVVFKALDNKKLKRICPDTWRECFCKGVA